MTFFFEVVHINYRKYYLYDYEKIGSGLKLIKLSWLKFELKLDSPDNQTSNFHKRLICFAAISTIPAPTLESHSTGNIHPQFHIQNIEKIYKYHLLLISHIQY